MNGERVQSREEFEALVAAGGRPKYLFFWGHTPKAPGRVDASCLSNWFLAPFTVDGVRYATAEHYMVAAKARIFADAEALARILAAPSPGAAKRLGREVRGFDDAIWGRERFDIVAGGNTAKFGQNPELSAFLAATGTTVLVETSPRDRIWGIGMGKDHLDAESPARWKGLNLLGFALMEARARLRS